MDDYQDDSDYEDYDCGCDCYDDDDDNDYDDFCGGEDDSSDSYEEEEEEEEEEEVMEDHEEQEEESVEDDEQVEEVVEEVVEAEEEAVVELVEDDDEEDEDEEEEEELDGEEGSDENITDYEDEIEVAVPLYVPRPAAPAPLPAISSPFLSGVAFPAPRYLNIESGSWNLGGGDGEGVGGHGSDRRGSESGDGTASSRTTDNNVKESDGKVVESRGIEGAGAGNESNWSGFQGPICPICYERWAGEGEHCVCCLPCGHLYGLSCIKMWLQRPNSQKCPQCNDACKLADVRRLFGVHLAATGDEELQQKVKSLEVKCASLELKDAAWLRKEAEWQKREVDLQRQLNQHKEVGLVKDIIIQGDATEKGDPIGEPEPSNALKDSRN